MRTSSQDTAPSPYRRLLPLAVLLVLLGLAVLLRSGTDDEGRQEDPTTRPGSFGQSFAPASVARIVLTRGSEAAGEDAAEKVVLSRRDGDWRIGNWHGAPADDTRVTRYLELLAELRGDVRETVAGEAAFGLTSDHALHVRLFGGGGNEILHLLVGRPPRPSTPDAQSRPRGVFARLSRSTRVLEVFDDLLSVPGGQGDTASVLLHRAWFDPVVVSVPQRQVKGVEAQWPQRRLTVVDAAFGKLSVRQWRATENSLAMPLDANGPNLLLGAVTDLQADGVVPSEEAGDLPLGDDAPYRMRVLQGQGEPITVSAAPLATGDAFALRASTRPETVYLLHDWAFRRLFRPAGELHRLPRPPFDVRFARRLILQPSDGPRRVLVRGDPRWKLHEPALKQEVDEEAVGALAGAVLQLRWADAVDATAIEDERAGLDVDGSFAVVRYIDKDGNEEAIRIGARTRGGVGRYARVEGTAGPIMVVSHGDIESLFPAMGQLVKLQMLSEMTAKSTERFAVESADRSFTLSRSERGEWELAFAGGRFEGRQMTIQRWLDGFYQLTADGATLGDAPDTDADITFTIKPAGEEPFTLQIHYAIQGRHTIRRSDRVLLFEVDQWKTGELLPDPAELATKKIEE